jgi:hypothetical protein
MSEETKKVEKSEQEAKPAELSELDLEQVAGGADIGQPLDKHKVETAAAQINYPIKYLPSI